MKHPFWLVAALGLGLIAYVQLWDEREPVIPILALGMQPQIELIEEIASKNGWVISCRGSSGEMIVARLVPGWWPWPSSSETLNEEIAIVASSTSRSRANGVNHSEECDLPADNYRLSIDPDDDPLVVGVGKREYLEPMLEIAEKCEVQGARLAPVNAEDQNIVEGELPPDWLGLIVNPAKESRTGPISCLGILSNRLEQSRGTLD